MSFGFSFMTHLSGRRRPWPRRHVYDYDFQYAWGVDVVGRVCHLRLALDGLPNHVDAGSSRRLAQDLGIAGRLVVDAFQQCLPAIIATKVRTLEARLGVAERHSSDICPCCDVRTHANAGALQAADEFARRRPAGPRSLDQSLEDQARGKIRRLSRASSLLGSFHLSL
jgi:hypothetical protein